MARIFVLGLGVARLGAGTAQVVAPGRFLDRLGSPPPSGSPAPAWRMKGGRDLAFGLLTMAARSDDTSLAGLAAAAVVVDGMDGIAVFADQGRHMGRLVHPAGGVLGLVVAAGAAWAAAVLAREAG